MLFHVHESMKLKRNQKRTNWREKKRIMENQTK